MKKLTVLLFSLFLLLSGCAASAPASEGKLSVVTTIYPLADWAEEVIGDEDVEVTCLLQKGVDLHNYQPSAADILKIANADLSSQFETKAKTCRKRKAIKNLEERINTFLTLVL